jgi:hypothetical protein
MWRRVELWNRLAIEGNHDLIAKLAFVERREPGFGVVIVPPRGFSENDETHNAVLDFLRDDLGVEVVNPALEKTRLRRALHGWEEPA